MCGRRYPLRVQAIGRMMIVSRSVTVKTCVVLEKTNNGRIAPFSVFSLADACACILRRGGRKAKIFSQNTVQQHSCNIVGT